MRRLSLSLLLVVALVVPATVWGASVSGNLSVAVTSTQSGTCPADDGSTGASAGTPQLPNLLNGYARTIRELGCQVAGVDYHVGAAAGTSFVDPTTQLPVGCTYHGSPGGFFTEITCQDPNGITFQNMDFGLHNGTNVVLLGSCTGPITFTNNTYLQGANQNLPLVRNQCSTQTGQVVCTYNSIDGGSNGTSSNYGGFLDEGCDVAEWNYLTRVPEDVFWPGSNSPTQKYNLIYLEGYTRGGHPDGVQWQGESVSNELFSFNTYVNINQGQAASSAVQPLHILTQGGSSPGRYTMSNPVVSYNTLVFPAPSGAATTIVVCGGDTNDPTTGFQAYGNYMDGAGAGGFVGGSNPAGACSNPVWGSPYGNIDMVTGVTIPHP